MNRMNMKHWTLTGLVSLSLIGLALFLGGCEKAVDSETHEDGHADMTEHHAVTEPTGVVNTTCPIMGKQIDPADVPATLTREWNGQTVGFCCAACPAAWDKLSDAEKKQKLMEPMDGDAMDHSTMDH